MLGPILKISCKNNKSGINCCSATGGGIFLFIKCAPLPHSIQFCYLFLNGTALLLSQVAHFHYSGTKNKPEYLWYNKLQDICRELWGMHELEIK